jgi:hypothetical protein
MICPTGYNDGALKTGTKVMAEKSKKKFIGATLIGILVLYIGSYVVLSAGGDYKITTSGEHRLLGLALSDTRKWVPSNIECEMFKGPKGNLEIRTMNVLGAIYAPMVWIDRTFIHQTKDYS